MGSVSSNGVRRRHRRRVGRVGDDGDNDDWAVVSVMSSSSKRRQQFWGGMVLLLLSAIFSVTTCVAKNEEIANAAASTEAGDELTKLVGQTLNSGKGLEALGQFAKSLEAQGPKRGELTAELLKDLQASEKKAKKYDRMIVGGGITAFLSLLGTGLIPKRAQRDGSMNNVKPLTGLALFLLAMGTSLGLVIKGSVSKDKIDKKIKSLRERIENLQEDETTLKDLSLAAKAAAEQRAIEEAVAEAATAAPVAEAATAVAEEATAVAEAATAASPKQQQLRKEGEETAEAAVEVAEAVEAAEALAQAASGSGVQEQQRKEEAQEAAIDKIVDDIFNDREKEYSSLAAVPQL